MLTIKPTGDILGATIEGLDLAQPLNEHEFSQVIAALGQYGVLRFPTQELTPAGLQAFSERFGDIQAGSRKPATAAAGVGTLSNVMQNGAYIGSPDAGQDWHTDMSYRDVMGFVNVLYGIQIPRRNGKALGGTEFANMHMAYEALPPDVKEQLQDATAVHNFEKFWEHMRQDRGSGRPPMSDEQRRRRPPVTHPIFLTHPITGNKVLYANPGYTTKINGMSESESDAMLAFLFEHQLLEKFRYLYTWTEGDVLLWEHFGTLHRALANYGPNEHRLMKRCQVLANKIFDPAYRKSVALEPLAA
jgi:taurine dioxygenase